MRNETARQKGEMRNEHIISTRFYYVRRIYRIPISGTYEG